MHVTLIVVTSLLGASLASPTSQEDKALPLPVATADYDPCVAGGPRYYSYRSDPHKFIDCGDDMFPTLKICPQHLVWSPVANYCDYPEHAGVTSVVTFTAHPPLHVQGPGNAGSYVYATNFAAPCTRERVQRNQLYWPYPGYIHYYILCDSSGNSLVMACLPNHVYDAGIQSCVSTQTQSPGAVSTQAPIYVTRPPGTTPVGGIGVGGGNLLYSTGFKAPCTAEHVQKDQLYWPFSGSPHFYIQCDLFGDAFLMACQPGYNYSHDSHTCVVGAAQFPFVTTNGPGTFNTHAPNGVKPQAGNLFATGFSAPCTQDVIRRNELYWPYPGVPNLYIHCNLFGDALIQGCQPGFVFYQASHTCVDTIPVG